MIQSCFDAYFSDELPEGVYEAVLQNKETEDKKVGL